MELLSLKIIILTLSGVIRLIFGMLPMVLIRSLTKRFRKDSKLKTVISLLMFFGGGVLLATCFLHMMPEVRESFQCAVPDSALPIAELIFIGGFFLVYMLEDVIHGCIDRRRRTSKTKELKNKNNNDSHSKSKHRHSTDESSLDSSISGDHDKTFQANLNGSYQSTGDIATVVHPIATSRSTSYHGEIPVGGVSVLPRLNKSPSPDSYNINNVQSQIQQNNLKNNPDPTQGQGGSPSPAGHFGVEKFSYVDPDWWRDTVIANSQMNLLSTSTFSVGNDATGKQGVSKPNGHPGVKPAGHLPSTPVARGTDTSSESSSSSDSHCHDHSHVPITEDDESIGGSIRNLLIVIAISFHGVFEGLAIGLQPTAKDLWYLFLAVSLHECTILFCIGVELISSKTKVIKMITYIMVVSLVNPIGIAIGIVVSEKSFSDVAEHALIVGSFQGLAAGTLLYVTFFEIFASEGKKLKTKGFHILTAVLGFVLMASLELIGGHNHNHKCQSHSHSHSSPSSVNGTFLDGHGDHDHDSHAPTGFHDHEDHSHHDHNHSH